MIMEYRELLHHTNFGLLEIQERLIDVNLATINLLTNFYINKKCHKHVTNAPKGIGLA